VNLFKHLKKIDVRYLFLLFFGGVFFDALGSGMSLKTPMHLLAATVGFLGSDILFNYLRHRKFIVPLSGIVSSCGTFILISGPYLWPTFLCGLLGSYSKHFFRFNDKHWFNPVNIGALATLFYFREYAQNGASTFSGNVYMIPYLIILGLTLTYCANRIIVSLSYVGVFFAIHFAFLRDSLPLNASAMMSPPFMLYVFFMISDPKTSPSKLKNQILFGALLAVVESYLRYSRILNSPLWALVIVCALRLAYCTLVQPKLASREKSLALNSEAA
jgi:enediyne biosynthesis protein E5